jgi:hypothetical protein
MGAKALRYLDAATRLVWIVYPRRQQVDAWRPGAIKPARILNLGDVLDGEEVVPGFIYPVTSLFN